jgi:hypothetical protein
LQKRSQIKSGSSPNPNSRSQKVGLYQRGYPPTSTRPKKARTFWMATGLWIDRCHRNLAFTLKSVCLRRPKASVPFFWGRHLMRRIRSHIKSPCIPMHQLAQCMWTCTMYHVPPGWGHGQDHSFFFFFLFFKEFLYVA